MMLEKTANQIFSNLDRELKLFIEAPLMLVDNNIRCILQFRNLKVESSICSPLLHGQFLIFIVPTRVTRRATALTLSRFRRSCLQPNPLCEFLFCNRWETKIKVFRDAAKSILLSSHLIAAKLSCSFHATCFHRQPPYWRLTYDERGWVGNKHMIQAGLEPA